MSHREGQESQPCYMDGVCVKISEKYKPPPRINLAITYAQRLSLSSEIQDFVIPYDFSLERNVKERVRELRSVREASEEEKKYRLENIRNARRKYEESKATKEIKKLNACDKDTEMFSVSSEINNAETEQSFNRVSQILNVPISNNDVLMFPTSYSHILTPTPLIASQAFTCSPNDKSPFNISEFEADTSSPFDNMELKTINDIEELAQVLKKDKAYNVPAQQIYSNYVPLPSTHSSYIGQDTLTNTYSKYGNYIPQPINSSTYAQLPSRTPSLYNNVNGYYYSPEMLRLNHQNFTPYAYNNVVLDGSPPQQQGISKKATFRSVPDIMKALETELDNTHIHNNHREDPASLKSKNMELEDPYESLPKNLQHLSKNISTMGFPLSRVARACQAFGSDQKKIVEHLLVMSELLDLGFSEENISTALLKCNNDRDKALDILIS